MLDYNELTKGHDYSVEIERAFGPNGLGILTVSNVPRLEELRAALLPLARKISLLSDTAITKLEVPDSFYSSGWSHGKERLQGKPDNAKGSFYANPLYDSITEDQDLIKKYALKADVDKNTDVIISKMINDQDVNELYNNMPLFFREKVLIEYNFVVYFYLIYCKYLQIYL